MVEELVKYGLNYYTYAHPKCSEHVEFAKANYLYLNTNQEKNSVLEYKHIREAVENGDSNRIITALRALDIELADKVNVLLGIQ